MHWKYNDIAEFVLVYIREAHASDGPSPLQVRGEKPILAPKTLKDRCSIADRFMTKKKFPYIVVADNIENTVDNDYEAFPDRIYVVDVEGNIAIQGAPGPTGFTGSIKRVKKWLINYRKNLSVAEKKEKKAGS